MKQSYLPKWLPFKLRLIPATTTVICHHIGTAWGSQRLRLDGVTLTGHQVRFFGSTSSILDVLWRLLTSEWETFYYSFLLLQFIHIPLHQTSFFLISQSFSSRSLSSHHCLSGTFPGKVIIYLQSVFSLNPLFWAIQHMNKAWPFLFCWLLTRDLPVTLSCLWVEREAPVQYLWVSMGIWGISLYLFTYSFQPCSYLITYLLLPSDGRFLFQQLPKLMTCWIWKNPAHDRQFCPHGHLMSHDWVLYLYQNSFACLEKFF